MKYKEEIKGLLSIIVVLWLMWSLRNNGLWLSEHYDSVSDTAMGLMVGIISTKVAALVWIGKSLFR